MSAAGNVRQSQSSATQYVQNEQTSGKYTFSVSNIPKNIGKIAFPIIALFALSNIPGAEAGPMAYALCVEACFVATATFPPLMPACVFGCIPLLGAPTP